MKLKQLTLLPLVAVMFGCGTLGMYTEDMDDQSLCSYYNRYQTTEARKEIIRRDLLTEEQWNLVEDRKIQMGMPEIALICSWGLPKSVNTSVASEGHDEQWVYGVGSSVYLRNHEVTSWQLD